MLKNILKTSIRSLLKNKGFTLLNIMGLAIGLATCLLITFYVRNELSFDRFNNKYERIYRINTDLRYGGTTTSFAITAAPVADALVKNFPGVENAVRLAPAVGMRFKKGNEIIQENKVVYCDPSIFDIFTLPMIEGDPRTALEEPNSMVITESAAKKYFNRTNVVGMSLFSVGDSTVYKITGVIQDIPKQSHFHFNSFISLLSIPSNYYSKNWGGLKDNTYILLKPDASYKKVEAQFPSLLKENIGQDFFNTLNKYGDYMRLSLTPLKDIHLRSNRQRELEANSNIQYIYIFSSLAILILLIASINFMNLSTARYTNRVREIGVRKVLGSPRKYLIAQFLSESILITFFAAIIAVIIAWMLLPLFNQISEEEIDITLKTAKWLLPLLTIMTLGVGILSGLYPAFLLSSFKPIYIFNGKFSASFKKNNFRNFLVVFQFAISVFLIIGTLVIYNQLNYIHSKNLGFNRDHIFVIENVGDLDNPTILKQQVKQMPGVIDASLSAFLPTNGNRYTNFIFSGNNNKPIQTQFWLVDADYIKTLEMDLAQGRDFSSNFATDSSAIIINETAAKMLGFSNNALNKVLHSFTHGVKKTYHIIGVVKDFNFNSLRDNVTPLVMVLGKDLRACLSIRIKTNNLPHLIAQVKNKWKVLAPYHAFTYSFMDKDFDSIYQAERRMAEIFLIFSILAIMVACLGLLGLSTYTAERRTKEIGIRKVLGASVGNIMSMLSKDFLKLILIAIFIASPTAWWIMNKWLQSFAYRVNISWWIFFLAGGIAILIALFTVSFQAIKAAMANPVESLQNE